MIVTGYVSDKNVLIDLDQYKLKSCFLDNMQRKDCKKLLTGFTNFCKY